MSTVWEKEINALIQEGEDILKRAYAIDAGDESVRLNLNGIRAWAREMEVVAKKLEIILPPSEECLKSVILWETPATTYVTRVLSRFGKQPEKGVANTQMSTSATKPEPSISKPTYDVALSFAGEDRPEAEELAEILKNKGVNVFYDEYEKANLWGKDLYEYLAWVYKDAAQYCIMFLSEHYHKKLWTSHERKNAQARAFREQSEYILPVRLDDTKIPGITETTCYINLRETTSQKVADLIIQKLQNG